MNKKEDVYISSDEAVKIGFADGIFDGNLDGLKKRLTKNRIVITPNPLSTTQIFTTAI